MKTKLLLSFLFLFSLAGYAQFFEGFENTTGPDALPSTNWTLGSGNWAVFDNGVGTTQRWGINSVSPQVYQGTKAAYIRNENIGQGNTSQDFLVTPAITVPDNGKLHFFTRSFTSGNQLTLYKIMVAPATNPANQTNPTPYALIKQWTEANLTAVFNIYEEKVVDLSAYAGQQLFVAFVHEQTQPTTALGGDRWLVDNVSIIDSGPCPLTTAIAVNNVLGTSAVVNWVENGATSWQVLLVTQGTPAPTPTATGWVATATNSLIVTGLNSNTSYDVYVRSVCGNGMVSDWSNSIPFTTGLGCGDNFLDQGGLNTNYSINSNNTTTICPSIPNTAVSVTFSSFNTEATHDALYVYNGNSLAATLISSSNLGGNVPGGLTGGYWGNTIPGPFTSSAPGGCLTFRFVSDDANTLEGWVANINCVPEVCNAPTNLTVNNFWQNSALISWINASNAYSTQILVLPYGSPSPTSVDSGTYAISNGSNAFIVSNLSPNQCYSVYVKSVCSFNSDWSSPVNFCMFNCQNNGGCSEGLELIAFIDNNNNGVKDSGEGNFPSGHFVFEINDTGLNQCGYTNNGPYYIFDSNPANSYDLSFQISSQSTAYYSSSVTYNNITLPTGSGYNVLYFPIVVTQSYTDVETYTVGFYQPQPGHTFTNLVYYKNIGTQTIANGTLTYTKDPSLVINSIGGPGVVTSTGFTYNITNFAPFQTVYRYVEQTVPPLPDVYLGQLLTSTAAINISNDVNLTNNSSTDTRAVVASYDPNEKSESHGGKIGLDSFTSNDYLFYTIQFENTGTANAEFIKVEDVLDAGLDENTFEMISASHTVNAKREGNQLTWHFYNINLPTTTASPNESHGYINFKIKPKSGYTVGDVIPNNASIYFDYNPPIVTNICATEFVTTLSNELFIKDAITLYPNPAHQKVYINLRNTAEQIESIRIFDVLGKTMSILPDISSTQASIDTSVLSKGVYMVEVTTEHNLKQIKKLVIQ